MQRSSHHGRRCLRLTHPINRHKTQATHCLRGRGLGAESAEQEVMALNSGQRESAGYQINGGAPFFTQGLTD